MLAQQRRRWASISPALGQCLVLAGVASNCTIETAGKSPHLRGHRHTDKKEVLNQYVPPLCLQRGEDI